jgi:methyl-accepting chemotaxis protein
MKLSDVSIRTRLLLLGVFTNALLLVTVGMGAVATSRLNTRLDQALEGQARVQATRDVARAAQLESARERREARDALLYAADTESRDRHLAAFEEAGAGVDQRLEALVGRMPSIGLDAEPAARARSAHREAAARYREALAHGALDVIGAAAVARSLEAIDAGRTQDLEAIAAEIGRSAEAQGAQAGHAADRERDTSLVLLGLVAVVALVVSTIVGMTNARTIVPPLGHAVQLAKAVAAGDLTARIEAGGRDELGQVLDSLRDMNASLADTVARVQAGAQSVMDASTHIADSTTDLSSRTEQQASSLEETAASIEQMTSTVDQNVTNARTANERASQAAQVAKRGGDVVHQVVEMMQRIQSSSREISEIIGLIDSIAFQTNILALNAAVEAARAGESGQGFAVVAKEVRYLAQRTADSAKRIKELIGGAVEAVDSGAALAGDAGRTMEQVTASVNEVSTIIADIASATREQQLGISQINQAVMELERVTQQNASMVQDSAAESESLRQMARQLERAVGIFKLREEAAATV